MVRMTESGWLQKHLRRVPKRLVAVPVTLLIGICGLVALYFGWQGRVERRARAMGLRPIYHLRVVDESGRAIAGAQADVVLTEFGIWGKRPIVSHPEPIVSDQSGRIAISLARQDLQPGPELVVSAEGFQSFKSRVTLDPIWKAAEGRVRRIILRRSDVPIPVHRLNWGREGFFEELKVPWTGAPIWLSLETGKLSAGAGGISIEVDRAPFNDAEKTEKPGRVRLSYPDGLLEPMVEYELHRSQTSIAAWGTVKTLEFSFKNSQGFPAVVVHVAFCSDDRKVRGLLELLVDPIGEWKEPSALVGLNLRGRAEIYAP